MLQYKIVIYWSEEDQAFLAEVPELSGCAADGSTYQEAIQNVEVVMREWIETAKELKRSIPEPTLHITATQSIETAASNPVIRDSSVTINP